MKVCPECGTEYEDHVPLCLADGVELIAAAAPVAAPPPMAAPAASEPSSGGSSRAPWLLLLIPIGLLLLVGVAGVGFVVMSSGTPPEPVPVPVPVPVLPDPAPPPAPVEAPPKQVAFVTIPEGAELFENDQLVCAAPCSVSHPPHAPLPRTFVVKASGYRDSTFEMEVAEGPFLIELTRIRTAPKPPPPRPTAPAPGPQVPRPSIGRDRGKDGG